MNMSLVRFFIPLAGLLLVGLIDGVWLPNWLQRRREKKELLAKERMAQGGAQD